MSFFLVSPLEDDGVAHGSKYTNGQAIGAAISPNTPAAVQVENQGDSQWRSAAVMIVSVAHPITMIIFSLW
jgi:hypothetical protein